jgi:hypothetical protein
LLSARSAVDFLTSRGNGRQVSVIQDVLIQQGGSPRHLATVTGQKKEVAVRPDRSTFVRRGAFGLFLASALALCGCGGANSEGSATASTEEGKRFNSMQKLGALQSKEVIAAKKKEALAEIARKKAGGARP